MHTHHLHTGIEEEDTAGQDYVVDLLQVGEETLRHIHIVVAACRDVDNSQHDKYSCGYDCAYHSAPFADFADPAKASEGNNRCDPIDGKHDDKREEFVQTWYNLAKWSVD